jgi:transglutaminase-like putative cysteine protease
MIVSSTTSQATLGIIPDGVPGIVATLKIMSAYVEAGKKSMTVRDKVLSLTQSLGQKDFVAEIKALHRFVRDDIRYLMDPCDVELVQHPDATLRNRQGDCDDKSTLMCAMLESIGHPTRFVAIGFEPNIYEHVYCETLIGERWVSCETTEDVEIGWQPPSGMIRARKYHYN